jgi:hypothetical protein
MKLVIWISVMGDTSSICLTKFSLRVNAVVALLEQSFLLLKELIIFFGRNLYYCC